ncbi:MULTISPECIES: helix-turn-helix domain-containing protein [unclassified Streptomyces]|uniref:MarR family transcriptional regulator n=1 Tax=unclassified Streptomyces TaxID=2593676 RepID=UPI0013A6C14D|nr:MULTISPECIES: helix-turn-helix domain-containing protein [unclassified Streptomyces]
MSTYNTPVNHHPGKIACNPCCARIASRMQIQGKPLPKPLLLSIRLTAPLLFVLGGACAVIGQQNHDHLSVATALCLIVSSAGLIAHDLTQGRYRRDRDVLVHVAANPGVTAEQIASSLKIADRAVVAVLARLVGDGLVVQADEDSPARGSYRLVG